MARHPASLSPEEVGRVLRELSKSRELNERLSKRVYDLERRDREACRWRDTVEHRFDVVEGELDRQSQVDVAQLGMMNKLGRASKPPATDGPGGHRGKVVAAVATALVAALTWLVEWLGRR